MIRTINEQYRSYKRLRELAAKAPIHRRERLLRLAKMALALATAQLRNPDLRPKAHLTAPHPPTIMIDDPSPFDTLETWERHLAELKRWPDGTPLKSAIIETAEYWIAEKKKEGR